MLIVDSRETRCDIPNTLRSLGVPFEIAELSAGDYKLGPFLIERKSANDLVASILDGRLFEQAEAICLNADRPMIVIEGDLTAVVSAIDYESLLGAISALTVFWEIQVLHLPSSQSSARLVARMHKHLTDGLGYEVATRVAKPRAAPDGAMSQYLVSGLPGVGPELARRLVQHFGSAGAVFAASEKDLCSVKGIGAGTARKIVESLQLRPSSFRSTKSAPIL
ncbi:MAG: endonuclease [Hydrogenophaga sp.]|nr:endonuclease [Hydrogenophaga sp.]